MRDATPEPLSSAEVILTTAEMAAVDRAAVASGMPLKQLIGRAGAAAAEFVGHRFGRTTRIAVLCGPGNNGADGYLAAAALLRAGHQVEVFSEHHGSAEGVQAWAVAEWGRPILPLAQLQPHRHDCIVDALYGAGLSRPPFGIEAEAIAWINAADALVVAVDVPSGLNGDTGHPLGACIHADHTVTFFRRKPGHLLWPGRGLCGQVTVADIGLAEEHIRLAAMPLQFVNTPGLWAATIPAPSPAGHKYQRGHVLVVSGPELRTGASRLSAIAALHAGAGAVSIAGDRDALRVHAAHLTSIMLKVAAAPSDLEGLLRGHAFGAAVIGPAAGVGAMTLARIGALIEAKVPMVLDADALTSLVGEVSLLAHRRDGRPPLVLTPHAGEFERLFGRLLMEDASYQRLPPLLQSSKIERAKAAARIVQGVVAFKGIDTVVADVDGRACVNVNAGPELATAGSGDVLAGVIACNLAQGMPAFEAAAAGVWLHGATGARLGAGLVTDQLASAVRPLATQI